MTDRSQSIAGEEACRCRNRPVHTTFGRAEADPMGGRIACRLTRLSRG
jgi:hypothetical protein